MSEGAFWFIVATVSAGFALLAITHLWEKLKPDADEEEKASHRQLMKELEKYK